MLRSDEGIRRRSRGATREEANMEERTQAPPGLHVFAAGSLQTPFDQLAELWRTTSALPIVLSYANARDLAERIDAGERADVFASASPEHPAALHARGLVEQPRPFATNHLVIAVPAHSRAREIGVLGQPGCRVVIEVEGIPLGDYTRTLLRLLDEVIGNDFAAAAIANVVSQEQKVSAVLERLYRDQADVAVVYNTDIPPTAGRLRAIEVPVRVVGTYVIAGVLASPQPAAAAAWLALIEAPGGREILRQAGFDAAG